MTHTFRYPYIRILVDASDFFGKNMTPAVVLAHSVGIRLHRYLDDWLIVASDRQQLTQDKLSKLSLLINIVKYDLNLSQTATYLGMYVARELTEQYRFVTLAMFSKTSLHLKSSAANFGKLVDTYVKFIQSNIINTIYYSVF